MYGTHSGPNLDILWTLFSALVQWQGPVLHEPGLRLRQLVPDMAKPPTCAQHVAEELLTAPWEQELGKEHVSERGVTCISKR